MTPNDAPLRVEGTRLVCRHPLTNLGWDHHRGEWFDPTLSASAVPAPCGSPNCCGLLDSRRVAVLTTVEWPTGRRVVRGGLTSCWPMG